MAADPLLPILLQTLIAVALGDGLDHNRFAIRQQAQAELHRLPVTATVGVQMLAYRSPECHHQAERWLTAKRTSPTPIDYGVLCYGDWDTAVLLFAIHQERYTGLLRANGVVQPNEYFAFENKPIRPWEHPTALKSIRQRLGVLPYEGLPSDGCHSIYRSNP